MAKTTQRTRWKTGGVPFMIVTALVGTISPSAFAGSARQGDGRDIQGTWTISFSTSGNPEGNFDDPNSRLPQPPPALRPEYATIWEGRQVAARAAVARGEPVATLTTDCLPPGMPAMMGDGGPFPMEILVTDDQVTIIQEAQTQIRRIYLDRPQPDPEEVEPGYFGRSVGVWRDETLVVETIGIKEAVEFRRIPHTLEMRITERIYLAGPDRLRNDLTIHDPAVFERPWELTFEYERLPGYDMMEYVCEDNREYADSDGFTRFRFD